MKLIKKYQKFHNKNQVLSSVILVIITLFILNNFFGIIIEKFGGKSDTTDLYAASDVITLKPDDFKKSDKGFKVKGYKGKRGIVVFYAPWCGHCKSMVGDFKELATKVQKQSKAYCGGFNCVEHKSLADEMGIKGFPTIKTVDEKGNMSDYQGGRTPDEMMSVLK